MCNFCNKERQPMIETATESYGNIDKANTNYKRWLSEHKIKMRGFPHDCGTVDTYATVKYSVDHKVQCRVIEYDRCRPLQ